MARKRIEFKVGGATVSVDIEDAKELKEEIKDIKSIAEILKHDLKEVIPVPVIVRADLTHIFASYGEYLSFISKSKLKRNEQVMLTVYGYGSKGATLDQIETTTGISKVRVNVIYSGHNKHYFRNLGNNRFTLSKDGEDTLRKEILPKLK